MLLTFAEQQIIKEVSKNNQKKFEQIMKEVEELELDKLLGTTFYQDISNNPNNYQELLSGCSFEDSNGYTIYQKGLKYVLAYLNYAKYIQEAHIQDTFTGIVQKTRPDSEQISSGGIKNLVQNNREIAFNYFEKIRLYLQLNSDKYPLYYLQKEKRVKDFTFFGVSKKLK